MAHYNDDNLGKKYEMFLYDYFKNNRAEGTNIELVTDELRQKAGADVICEGVIFDAKSSTKTAETGNLQFDIWESFDGCRSYRTGWMFNGHMTDWLVFYVPYGDKLIEYSVSKTEVMSFYQQNVLDAYDFSGDLYSDAEKAKKVLLYNKNKLTQHFPCTADGGSHYTIIWCPNVYELAKHISIFKRVYQFDHVISPVDNSISYENAELIEHMHRVK